MANVSVAGEQHTQPGGEHVGAGRRGVELGVEVVQQPGDLLGVVHRRQPWLATRPGPQGSSYKRPARTLVSASDHQARRSGGVPGTAA